MSDREPSPVAHLLAALVTAFIVNDRSPDTLSKLANLCDELSDEDVGRSHRFPLAPPEPFSIVGGYEL